MSCNSCKCDCSCTPEKGDQGLPGIPGDAGEQGAQGIQGEQGAQGDQGIQGVRGQDGTDPVFENWNDIVLENGWAALVTPQYCKNSNELAMLRGTLVKTFSNVSSQILIAKLPPTYRPTIDLNIPVYFQRTGGGQITAFTDNEFMTVKLNTLGELILLQASGFGDFQVAIDLAAITYRAEQ